MSWSKIFSPLIVQTTREHDELKQIAARCVTRHHVHHYLGFAETQWKLFIKESPPKVKPLLYIYRVLLTGIHLMRTGEVLANLPALNEVAKLSYLPDLLARKVGGPELSRLPKADLAFHQSEYERLRSLLIETSERSTLPESPEGTEDLNNLLVRLRLQTE